MRRARVQWGAGWWPWFRSLCGRPGQLGDGGSGFPRSLMRSQRVASLVVVSLLLLLPAAARAQPSITGVVRDPSGGVLPGVTVEAGSPALIDKVRSVVTD